MTIDEIKSAYEFASSTVEELNKRGEAVPATFIERVMNIWKGTIDLYRSEEAQSFYVYEFEGEQTVVNKQGCEVWPFFREVAAVIAMSDCSEQKIVKIVYDGKEYRYAGWKPGMEFTFIDKDDHMNAYTVWMEHLDH